MAAVRWSRRGALLSLWVPLLFSGCVGLKEGQPPGAWHDAYQPLDDPAAEKFFFGALERAKIEFGDPVVPVNRVLFRRSKKTAAARAYRIGENFSLTQCVDSTNGVFVVYIGVDPGHRNFYPLLGHEAAHFINARITDWYMEGVATVLAWIFVIPGLIIHWYAAATYIPAAKVALMEGRAARDQIPSRP